MNYKFLNSAGTWRKNDVASEKDINDTNLGGVERLLALKAIEETSDPVRVQASEPSDPNTTKGDTVEAGDTVEKRRARREEAVGSANDGTRTSSDAGTPLGDAGNDAAAVSNPRTGRPGDVTRVNVGKRPGAR